MLTINGVSYNKYLTACTVSQVTRSETVINTLAGTQYPYGTGKGYEAAMTLSLVPTDVVRSLTHAITGRRDDVRGVLFGRCGDHWPHLQGVRCDYGAAKRSRWRTLDCVLHRHHRGLGGKEMIETNAAWKRIAIDPYHHTTFDLTVDGGRSRRTGSRCPRRSHRRSTPTGGASATWRPAA